MDVFVFFTFSSGSDTEKSMAVVLSDIVAKCNGYRERIQIGREQDGYRERERGREKSSIRDSNRANQNPHNFGRLVSKVAKEQTIMKMTERRKAAASSLPSLSVVAAAAYEGERDTHTQPLPNTEQSQNCTCTVC